MEERTVCFTFLYSECNVAFIVSGVARGFIILKSTKKERYGELIDIWPCFLKSNNNGADQTARMRRLVCAFDVRKQQIQDFSLRGPLSLLKHRLPGLRMATRLIVILPLLAVSWVGL